MKLNPVLAVDLDDLDDKEFDIPRVDKPPTLESILNAPDEDAPIADNCIVDGTLQVGTHPLHFSQLGCQLVGLLACLATRSCVHLHSWLYCILVYCLLTNKYVDDDDDTQHVCHILL